MVELKDSATVLDAIGIYAGALKTKEVQADLQKQLMRFGQWCGPERKLSDLEPSEIGLYAEHSNGTGNGIQTAERLQEVKKFLAFAKKKGMIEQNLAQHLRIRKPRTRTSAKSSGDRKRDVIEMTAEGHAELLQEVERLRAERGPITEEIHKAAATKDVRENAPLEAAREQLGQVESRIREIDATLNFAVIVDPSQRRGQSIQLGSQVVLKDGSSSRETRYTVVSASEAKPLDGKISDVSPVGNALMGRRAGQQISVDTPQGKIQYKIVRVK